METISLRRPSRAALVALAGTLLSGVSVAGEAGYGIGHAVPPQTIAAIDNDIRADGTGLPPGQGSFTEGEALYAQHCAACHGDNLEGRAVAGAMEHTPFTRALGLRGLLMGEPLVGGRGKLTDARPLRSVESYWPYATTLFDYIRRAMPFYNPGILTNDEVYALTAYILGRADIVPEDAVMNADTLPKVVMPNRNGFSWAWPAPGTSPLTP